MKHDYKIKPAKNGFILQATHYDEETEELVYQETEEDEVNAFAQFLRLIDDHYGPDTSRYSAERIKVSVVPGDKHEGVNEKAKAAFKRYLEYEKNPTIEEAFLAGWDFSD